jgi:hypothetical protein
MPQLGSQTQYPRQPTRWAAGIVARSGHATVTSYLAKNLRLNLGLSAPIGHYGTQPKKFDSPAFHGRFLITGITRNSSGAAIGGCIVELFKHDAVNTFVDRAMSDGSGSYKFILGDNATNYWLRAYLPGSPDLFGTTLRTLVCVME